MSLEDQVIALHLQLSARRIEHAFGGAIALAYWTTEPRGTRDIDINIFVSKDDCRAALEALPDGIHWNEKAVGTIRRSGQVRLFWDGTPVDVFFNELPIHEEAARHRHVVPFEGHQIPILGPIELALFKAMFDRTQDWADIEAMLRARTLDVDALKAKVVAHGGRADRLARLDEAAQTAAQRS